MKRKPTHSGNGRGNGRAKPEVPKITSAEEYLQIAEKPTAVEPVPVPMPSGATFLLRVPDITGYAMTGRMPQALTSTFIEAAESRGLKKLDEVKKNVAAVAEEISLSDAKESLIFVRDIVCEAVVSPKFGDGPGEIPYSKFKTEDFKFVFQWVLQHSGVAGLAGLQSFRSRRERRASKSRSNRKKLRRETVNPARH